MPQRRAAKKDLRQNKKRRLKNLTIKRNLRSAVKKLKKSLEEKNSKSQSAALQEVCKLLDKAASKKVIHKNKAANKKARLAKLVNPSKKSSRSEKKNKTS